MLTRREMMKALAVGSTAIAADLAGALALAAAEGEGETLSAGPAASKGVTVRGILHHELPDAPGKQLRMVTVEFAPGAGSPPHRHPGSVVAYVLEGAVVSQVDPGKPATYRAGQAWYEAPMHVHRVARNASKTRRAKILAILIVEKGQPLTLPAR